MNYGQRYETLWQLLCTLTAGIFFLLLSIALGCMVSLLHLNRKPVLWCGCKLDTVLEFAPLLSEGQTVCVTVSVVVQQPAVDVNSCTK